MVGHKNHVSSGRLHVLRIIMFLRPSESIFEHSRTQIARISSKKKRCWCSTLLGRNDAHEFRTGWQVKCPAKFWKSSKWSSQALKQPAALPMRKVRVGRMARLACKSRGMMLSARRHSKIKAQSRTKSLQLTYLGYRKARNSKAKAAKLFTQRKNAYRWSGHRGPTAACGQLAC